MMRSDWQLELGIDEKELHIMSPWFALAEFNGWRKPYPAVDLRGLHREEALARMHQIADYYTLRGWRVVWIWKEAQDEVHDRAEDSGITP
ncbi:MAG: hypothetical protein KatS3mg023_0577 [Armatimonadota bacterium]|nr:MAG: hypothetical protein KatS3mg023_0577 [Armatimonadota bacterium]